MSIFSISIRIINIHKTVLSISGHINNINMHYADLISAVLIISYDDGVHLPIFTLFQLSSGKSAAYISVLSIYEVKSTSMIHVLLTRYCDQTLLS